MLETIKQLLGLNGLKDSTEIDKTLNTIISLTTDRLKNLLGSDKDVPGRLGYIITEVSIVRYNRIGSEGLSSHNIEGESMTWSDNDFKPFMDDIESYLANQTEDDSNKRGRVRFL